MQICFVFFFFVFSSVERWTWRRLDAQVYMYIQYAFFVILERGSAVKQ